MPANRRDEKVPCVYILASRRNGTLYVGVTSNLAQRVWHHKTGAVPGFTQRYGVHRLVRYEAHLTMASAIEREKALKEWQRAWKLRLIERMNPCWRDLYDDAVLATACMPLRRVAEGWIPAFAGMTERRSPHG